jgi:hypothetical protein
MTIKGLVKFLLVENEKEHGLTYVGMSRVLACEQIDIGLSRLIRLIEDK